MRDETHICGKFHKGVTLKTRPRRICWQHLWCVQEGFVVLAGWACVFPPMLHAVSYKKIPHSSNLCDVLKSEAISYLSEMPCLVKTLTLVCSCFAADCIWAF